MNVTVTRFGCRDGGLDVASLREKMRTTRERVTQRRPDGALGQLRELKAEMLAQLEIHEAQHPLPPGEIENPPLGGPALEDVPSSLSRPPAWKVKTPRG